MKESKIIICDNDVVYAKALVQAFQRKKAFEANYIILSDPNKLLSYEKEHQVIIYILSEEAYEKGFSGYCKELEEEERAEFFKHLFLLTETTENNYPNLNCIFKYQPVNAIIEPVSCWFKDNFSELVAIPNHTRIIGVMEYAAGDTGCLLGHLLAKLYSESQSVLLMNMELFPFQFGNEKTAYNLSDYIYAVSTGSDCAIPIISGMQYSLGNLRCVSPIKYFEDLYELKAADVSNFMKQLKEQSGCDIIVLVFDFLRPFALDLLSECDKIVTCEQTNRVTLIKRQQLQQMLQLEQKEWVLEKMSYCNVETEYLLENITEEGEITQNAKEMFYEYLITLLG